MNSSRRRSFVSKPNFQLKLTIVFMLVVTIVANLVGGICYLFISEQVGALLAQNPDALPGLDMPMVARFLIPKILLAEAISLCLVFILSILITHTIAGPVYRLEKVAAEIGQGNLSIVTRLRPKDELKELADAFNDMTEGLVDRIQAVRDAVDRAAEADDGDLSAVQAALDEFRLPDERAAAPEDEDLEVREV